MIYWGENKAAFLFLFLFFSSGIARINRIYRTMFWLIRHNPYGIYPKGSGIGVPGHFQIIVEKSVFITYNMLNRTAGR